MSAATLIMSPTEQVYKGGNQVLTRGALSYMYLGKGEGQAGFLPRKMQIYRFLDKAEVRYVNELIVEVLSPPIGCERSVLPGSHPGRGG